MRAARHLPSDRLPVDQARHHDLHTFMDELDLETLREALGREMRVHGGQDALAQTIGVSRGTVRKLVGMQSVPTRRNLDRIREWAEHRPTVRVALGAVCLALLVKYLPAEIRGATRLRLARDLASAYAEAGRPVPLWLATECRRTW